jgi:hypothetical protein
VKVHYYSIRCGRVHSIIRYFYINMKDFESRIDVSTRVNDLTNQLPQFCIFGCLLQLAFPSLGISNDHSFITLSL